jgi:hypothetical protein
MRPVWSLLAAAMLAIPSGSPALACDCVRFIPGGPHFQRDLRNVAEAASVIMEGTIVRPMAGLGEPALVRSVRVLKGSRKTSYQVGIVSDCSLVLGEAEANSGRPLLLVLSGGPELYEASRCANLLGAEFEQALEHHASRSCGRR